MECFFFFSSRRRHTRCGRDWSSDVCSSDLGTGADREIRTIAAVGTAGADGTGITLSSPLTHAHASGVIVATPSQQAQAFGIYSGVASKADWSSLAGYIAAQGPRTAPMDWGVTVQALGILRARLATREIAPAAN